MRVTRKALLLNLPKNMAVTRNMTNSNISENLVFSRPCPGHGGTDEHT